MLSTALLSASYSPPEFPNSVSAAGLRERGYQYSFAEYQAHYGKSYGKDEVASREAIFLKALAEVRAHNEQSPPPSWVKGLSEHSDKGDALRLEIMGRHGIGVPLVNKENPGEA